MQFLIDLAGGALPDSPTEKRYYTDLFRLLALSCPDDEFTWVVNSGFAGRKFGKNVTLQVQKNYSPFGIPFFRQPAFNTLIKKQKPDVILLFNSFRKLPLHMAYSVFISNLSLVSSKKPAPNLLKKTGNVIHKAAAVITPFVSYTGWIKEHFDLPIEKMSVLPPLLIDDYMPLDWNRKLEAKERFAGGNEYFLYAGDIGEKSRLVLLLKAFSHFKKWQHSGMQLVIAGSVTPSTPDFETLLLSYKYRDHVQLITNPPEVDLQLLIGGSYCFIDPCIEIHFPIQVKKAMYCEVPVIATATEEIKEIGGDSIMYAADTEERLSHAMQLVYKNEQHRSMVLERQKKYLMTHPGSISVDDLRETLFGALKTK